MLKVKVKVAVPNDIRAVAGPKISDPMGLDPTTDGLDLRNASRTRFSGPGQDPGSLCSSNRYKLIPNYIVSFTEDIVAKHPAEQTEEKATQSPNDRLLLT